MPSPRRESQAGPTTAASYVLERKLLRAYEQLYQQHIGSIWQPAQRLVAQVQVLDSLPRAASRKGYAEHRLREIMPELIQRLTSEEQEPLKELLLGESPDLTQAVRYLTKMEHWHNHHQDDPRLKVNDDALCRAAGIGRLARADPGNFQKKSTPVVRVPLGPPLELTPFFPRPVRAKKRRVFRKRHAIAFPQLALEFPGGGVTLAAL